MLGVEIPPSAKRPQKCHTPSATYADILQRTQMRSERDTIHIARCTAWAELHAKALGLPYANDDEASRRECAHGDK